MSGSQTPGPLLLTVNAGSSTIKLGLYARHAGEVRPLGRGLVDLRRRPAVLTASLEGAPAETVLDAPPSDDLAALIAATLDWLDHHAPAGIVGVGHRVVHGGDRFHGPVLLTPEVEAAIAALTPLAPLHQPHSLRLIRAVRRHWPDTPQTASFDTAFHHTHSALVRRFALPRALFDQGIKRYGFHGLSYRHVAGQLARLEPGLARGRVVVAHLGSGASLCALENGISRDTSMGFSTLDGIPMATRCGALDAGVVLHLLRQGGLAMEEVEDILYHRAGLLGVSGISADSRVLLDSPEPAAREALDLFVFRIAQEVARLATTLGGLDGLVFTAGIGEHQPPVRAAVCRHLAWLGVVLDDTANAANAWRISGPGSRVAVRVVPTDEERIIATDTAAVLAAVPAAVPPARPP